MSNEKLEALMWYGYGRDELFARGVFFRKNGINRINVANRAEADDIAETHNTSLEKAWDAAHAIGVEEGKRKAAPVVKEAPPHYLFDGVKFNTLIHVADCGPPFPKGVYVHTEAEAAQMRKLASEAAPVDDGKKWRIMVGPANCTPVLSDAYAAEYSTADKDAILRANELNASRLGYTARPVEPKHVHEWSSPFPDGHRICLGDGCNARQVAEWKDEP